MRPLRTQQLTAEKRTFNYRARKTLENAFGIMPSCFRVFRRPMAVKRSTADEVVKACTELHNMLRIDSAYCEEIMGDHEDRNRIFMTDRGGRPGVSKCGARLETLLRGPTQ